MPKCLVCEGDSFDLQDGLYYCSNCQTQSQDLLEEEGEDEGPLSGYSSSSSIREIRIRAKKTKTEKNEINLGKKWSTHDAYNLVLKKQVDSLIALGASAQLKPVVLNLWMSYLEKSGLVKLKTSSWKDCRRKWRVYPRERDVQVLLGNCSKLVAFSPAYKAVKILHATRRMKKVKKAAKSQSSEGRVMDTVGSPESQYLSDCSVSSDDASLPSKSSFFRPNKILSKCAIQMKELPRSSFGFCIGRMKLSRTLSFIYLGLLLVRDQILLSDVMRWLWEDRIPLYNLADVFPEDMKFQAWDNQTFRLLHSITHEAIRSDTERLAKFLSISEIPVKPLQYITARFITELSLPASMHALILKLISFHSQKTVRTSKKKANHLLDYEGTAIAYVIVALKLTFELNDVSKCSLLEKQCFANKAGLFVFKDWRKQMCINRELQLLSWQRIIRHKVCSRSVDFDALASFYEEKAHKWKGRYCCRRVQWERADVEEICEILCRPFTLLKGRSIVHSTGTTAAPTSFPLRSEAGKVLSEIDRRLDRHPSADLTKSMEPLYRRTFLHVLDCKRVATTEASLDWPCSFRTYAPECSDGRSSSSLAWLLELCADMLEMKPDSIHRKVVAIEKALLRK